MGRILEVIIRKLGTLADACDRDIPSYKFKAIYALFPYAVRQERDKEYAILDALLHAAKTMCGFRFSWRHIRPFLDKLFDGTSHVSSQRALMLVSPYMPWGEQDFREDQARIWVAAASTVPKEEEIAPSVVDTLLQIASLGMLPPDLHSDTWSWLMLRPSLPPVCKGRKVGSHSRVVLMVRDLKDIEILKSYLLLIWSEWDSLHHEGYLRMMISVSQDFSGIGMNSHRADLLQRLDHVLEQLDKRLEYLQQSGPGLGLARPMFSFLDYGSLKQNLLEVDQEALEVLIRASSRLTTPFEPLTHAAARRITLDVHVCAPYPVSIAHHLGCLILVSLRRWYPCWVLAVH